MPMTLQLAAAHRWVKMMGGRDVEQKSHTVHLPSLDSLQILSIVLVQEGSMDRQLAQHPERFLEKPYSYFSSHTQMSRHLAMASAIQKVTFPSLYHAAG